MSCFVLPTKMIKRLRVAFCAAGIISRSFACVHHAAFLCGRTTVLCRAGVLNRGKAAGALPLEMFVGVGVSTTLCG